MWATARRCRTMYFWTARSALSCERCCCKARRSMGDNDLGDYVFRTSQCLDASPSRLHSRHARSRPAHARGPVMSPSASPLHQEPHSKRKAERASAAEPTIVLEARLSGRQWPDHVDGAATRVRDTVSVLLLEQRLPCAADFIHRPAGVGPERGCAALVRSVIVTFSREIAGSVTHLTRNDQVDGFEPCALSR